MRGGFLLQTCWGLKGYQCAPESTPLKPLHKRGPGPTGLLPFPNVAPWEKVPGRLPQVMGIWYVWTEKRKEEKRKTA